MHEMACISCKSVCETWVCVDRHSFPQCLGVLQRLPGRLRTRHAVSPPTPVWNYLHPYRLDKFFLQQPTQHKPDNPAHQHFNEYVGTSMQISPPVSITAYLHVRLVDFCPTALLSRRAMNLKSTCRPFSQAGGKQWSLSPSLCLLWLGMRSFSNREQSLQCPIRSVKQNKLERSAALCRHGHTKTKKNHMQDHLSA